MSNPELMPEDWQPNTKGRPQTVSPAPIMARINDMAAEHSGRWVVYSTYSRNEVRSLYRSLKKAGYEVRTEDNHNKLLVRVP